VQLGNQGRLGGGGGGPLEKTWKREGNLRSVKTELYHESKRRVPGNKGPLVLKEFTQI